MNKQDQKKNMPQNRPVKDKPGKNKKAGTGITAAELDNITASPVANAKPAAGRDVHDDGTWVDYKEKE